MDVVLKAAAPVQAFAEVQSMTSVPDVAGPRGEVVDRLKSLFRNSP